MEGFEKPPEKGNVALSSNNMEAYKLETIGPAIVFTKRELRSSLVLSFTLLEKEKNYLYSDYITCNLQMEVGLSTAQSSTKLHECWSLSDFDKDSTYMLDGELYKTFLRVMSVGHSIGLMVQEGSLFTFINGVNVEVINLRSSFIRKAFRAVINIGKRNHRVKMEMIDKSKLVHSRLICINTTAVDDKHFRELKYGTAVKVLCYSKDHEVKSVKIAWITVDEAVHDFKFEGQADTSCLDQIEEKTDLSNFSDIVQSFIEEKVTAEYSIIRMLCVGPPGVGKTCLKCALQGGKPPNRYESTSVKGETSRVIRHSSFSSKREQTEWVNLTFDKQVEQLASISIQHLQQKKIGSDDIQLSVDTVEQARPKECGAAKIPLQVMDLTLSNERSKTPGLIVGNVANIVASAETKHSKQGNNAGEKQHVLEHIFFTDCGGQPHFMEVLPAFIKGGTVVIVVIKLNEDLHKVPKFSFHKDHKDISIPGSYTTLTHLDILETVAHSISMYKKEKSGEAGPYLLVVATHIDKINFFFRDRKIAQVNRTLNSILGNVQNCIKHDELTESVVFPINTIDDKESMAQMIRDRIKQTVTGQTMKIPIRWHSFEIHVAAYSEKMKRKVLSRDECIEIGSNKEVCVPSEEIESVLVYYDCVNLYLFFPNILPEFVITDPQLLLELVSDLLKVSFVKPDFLPAGIQPGSQSRLKNVGLFEKSVLKKCINPVLEKESTIGFGIEQLATLLMHLNIIAKVSDEYFMPSALDICNDKDLLSIKQKYTDHFDPLLFLPQAKIVPQGFFTSLVAFCLNRDNSYFSCDDSSRKQHRNVVSLKYSCGGGSVLLISNKKWLEVCYSGGDPKDAYNIQQAIYNSFSSVCEVLPYDYSKLKFSVGFLCVLPNSKEHNALQHACKVDSHASSSLSVTCLQDTIGTADIGGDRRKTPWLVFDQILPGEISDQCVLQRKKEVKIHCRYGDLESITESDTKKLEDILEAQLRKHYADLEKMLEKTIDSFASQLLQRDLISRDAKSSPNKYDAIMEELLASLKFMTDPLKKIQHCCEVLSIIAEVGAPQKKTALLIAQNITDAIKTEFNVSVEFFELTS